MIEVKVVTTKEELDQAFTVRKIVFIDEQNVPEDLEIDDLESTSIHFLAKKDDQAVGAGRVRELEGYGKIERICVLKEMRGQQVGVAIMNCIEQYIQSNMKLPAGKLEAQVHAIPFYEKLGYEVCSEEFMDAGIPHRMMKKVF